MAQHAAQQQPQLCLLLVCYRPLAQLDLVPEPPHLSEGIQSRLTTHDCHFKQPASAGKLAGLCHHTHSWSAHKPTKPSNGEELRAATLT